MKKPVIRFKGFTNAWKVSPFGSLAKRASAANANEDLPRLEYEDIVAGTGLLNKNLFTKYSKKRGIVFHKGDVLYGKLRPYLHNWYLPMFTGLAVGDFWILQPQNIDSTFLYRLVQSRKFDVVANQSAGSKMPRADWKLVSNSDFFVPVEKMEQMAIGSFFAELDSLIEGKRVKLDKLKKLKQAYLNKMFPKKGFRVPEIRFKGFSGDWVEKPLGKIGSPYTGLSGKGKADFGHGNAKYITYMNVFSNPVATIEQTDKIEVDRMQNCVKKNDVFFTVSSETPEEVGMSSVWTYDAENVYLNSFCFGFRPNENIDPFYFAYLMRSPIERSQIILLAQGISRFNISKSKMMNISVLLPTIPEQQKIGAFFQNLDNLINLQQQELDKLSNIKSACLSKMFA